jgi:V8-like Glu-specific endopeptidase
MAKSLKWRSVELAKASASETVVAAVAAEEVGASASELLVHGHSSVSWSKPLLPVSGQTVIGTDDRKKITDADKHPWRMIASLTLFPKKGIGSYIGTGWFIHPKVLLTAGHCVFDAAMGGDVGRIVVRPGRGAGREPFGAVDATRFAMLDRWRSSQDPDYDVGCIFLSEPLGDRTGIFGLAAPSDGDLANRLVNISGYPADRDGGREQYFHANRVQSATARSIFYDVDTFGGQSGSPVFLAETPDARPTAIGIHAYGIGRLPPKVGMVANSGPRITADLLATINEWIAKA